MCNPSYCDKIEKSDKIFDLATNIGVMQSGLKCEVDKLREDWFNKTSLKNIFSFSNLVEKSRIKYDSKIEDAFWVYVDNKKVKFKRIPKRIYGMCPVTTNDDQKQLLKM